MNDDNKITRESIRERIRERLKGGPSSSSHTTDGGSGSQRPKRKRSVQGVEIEVRGSGSGHFSNGKSPEGSNSGESAEAFYGPGTTQSESFGQEQTQGRPTATDPGNDGQTNQPGNAQQPKGRRAKGKQFVERLAESDGGKTQKARRPLVENEDDCEDIKLIIQSVASALANALDYEKLNYTDSQAYSVARPAARLLARYGMDERVRKMSDPALLLLALGTTAGPKIAGYKAHRQWKAQEEAEIRQRMATEEYNRRVAQVNHPSQNPIVPPQPSGYSERQPGPESSMPPVSEGSISAETVQGASSTVINLQRRIANNE